MTILLILLLLIVVICIVLVIKQGSAEKKAKAKAKAKPAKESKQGVHYLFLPEDQITKIKNGEKTTQIRFPKMRDGTEWKDCKGCEIIFFANPRDGVRGDGPKDVYEKNKAIITSQISVIVTSIDAYKTLDAAIKELKIKGDEEVETRGRFPEHQVSERGGVIVLNFKKK